MKALFDKKRKSSKYAYELTLHHLIKLPKEGIIVYLSWKRGKKYAGETKKSFVKNATAVLEEDFSFKSTLFLNNMNKFKKKYLELYIHEVRLFYILRFTQIVSDQRARGDPILVL
jgi:N-terminal C2 in EEIG1 and EHBP1 proteins